MRVNLFAGLSAVAVTALVTACAENTKTTNTGARDYAQYCVECHGATGKGDGPAAAALNPKPVDLARLSAANGGKFPRANAMAHIYGFTMGRSESQMPMFGDLLEGESVPFDSGDGIQTATPVRLVALIEYLEGMQK